MPIIEKIEIKNFRSFGNRKKETVQIAKISDLNIFSWANDSWKSNILRALNLFFNDKVWLDSWLIFDRDFHKKNEVKDDNNVEQELITIKIRFHNEKNKWKNKWNTQTFLPEKFWVSKKWTSNWSPTTWSSIENAFKKEKWVYYDNFIEKDKDKKNYKWLKSTVQAGLQKQLTDFINSIQFQYIPAIKDKSYFSYLYWELQKSLWKIQNSKIEKTQKAFEHEIQEETSKLMEEFKSVISQNVSLNEANPFFQLPANLVDFFKTLKVNTWDIDLELRWDWVQAKLIPEILYFIAQKEKSYKQNKVRKWEKLKKYFIWWFEEPENSYEYKNAQLLAERFSSVFSNIAQIFVTTHSFSFISLKWNNISKYRVYKDKILNSSKILEVNDTPEWLFDFDAMHVVDNDLVSELWIYELSNELKKIYDYKNSEIEKLKNINLSIQKHQNILFVEDQYTNIYKISWLKLNDINFNEHNIDEVFAEYANFHIIWVEGKKCLYDKINQKHIEEFQWKKIVSLFDFDEAYNDFNWLKNEYREWIQGSEKDCLFRKRRNINNFYCLLIPVPDSLKDQAWRELWMESKLEIEHLFYWISKKIDLYFKEKKIYWWKIILFSKKENKRDFRKELLVCKKEDFRNIKPLFDFVKNVFWN